MNDVQATQSRSCLLWVNAPRRIDADQSHAFSSIINVRFGSKADMRLLNYDVRFTPKSGHRQARLGCPLCAISGLHALQQKISIG
jgi:hypothetical protein